MKKTVLICVCLGLLVGAISLGLEKLFIGKMAQVSDHETSNQGAAKAGYEPYFTRQNPISGDSRTQTSTVLTPLQATELAQRLANDKAESLYSCRPFSNSPPAQLVEGLWVWRARRGQGQADIEATVKFGTNGANPNVRIDLLDSRSLPLIREPYIRRR